MTVSPGIQGAGNVPMSQGIAGISRGGVLLPSGFTPSREGEIVTRRHITQPVTHKTQALPPPGWLEDQPGLAGNPLFAETAAGLTAYEAFLRSFFAYKVSYFAMKPELIDPAEGWHIVIPLVQTTYKLEKVNYGGPLEEDGSRPSRYWYPQYVPGAPPELFVAWCPTKPEEYKDHMGNPTLDPSSETPSSRLLLPPGSRGPIRVPLSWAGGAAWQPTYIGVSNYTPQSEDWAYEALETDHKLWAERIAELSAKTKEEQEEAIEAGDRLNEEELVAAEKAETIENEEEVRKKELEERFGHFVSGPLEPPWGPYPKEHLGLYDFYEKVGIAKGFLGDLSADLDYSGVGAYPYGERRAWALRLPLTRLPGFGSTIPGTGYLFFYLRLPSGNFFDHQGPVNAAVKNELPDTGLYLPELQKITGSSRALRIAGGGVKAGIPGGGLVLS